MYCNKCGAKINIEEDLFCISCGAKVVNRSSEIKVPSGLTSDAEDSVRIIDDFFTVDESRVRNQAKLSEELSLIPEIDSYEEDSIDLVDLELFDIPEIVLEFKGPEEELPSHEADDYPELPTFTEELIVRDNLEVTNRFERSIKEEAERTMNMVEEMFAELGYPDKHKSIDARKNLSKAVEAALEEERK